MGLLQDKLAKYVLICSFFTKKYICPWIKAHSMVKNSSICITFAIYKIA